MWSSETTKKNGAIPKSLMSRQAQEKLIVMVKKMIFRTALCLGLFSLVQLYSFAQGKTLDELKAEREALKSEMKSNEAVERQAKMEKLEAPAPCGIQSVDDLAAKSTANLAASKENNKLIPEMYKRTIGETVDGVTDVTVKKPTVAELTELAVNIGTQIKAVTDASTDVGNASNDIAKASPLKAPKGTKVLNYTKEVNSLLLPELQLNLKVVNNLIATLKSSGNY
jgi:hypothetical protein